MEADSPHRPGRHSFPQEFLRDTNRQRIHLLSSTRSFCALCVLAAVTCSLIAAQQRFIPTPYFDFHPLSKAPMANNRASSRIVGKQEVIRFLPVCPSFTKNPGAMLVACCIWCEPHL